MHPVAAALTAAARGTFPDADGSWARVAPWHAGVEAVIAFPRARHAASVRARVQTKGYAAHDDRTVVTLGAGLGGLPEVGIELDPAQRHTGSDVLRAALGLVPAGDVIVAGCAPGNARAVRAFLNAGFVPVGSVQLWRPERRAGG